LAVIWKYICDAWTYECQMQILPYVISVSFINAVY